MKAAIVLFGIYLIASTTTFAQITLPYGLAWGMTLSEARSHLEYYGFTVQDERLGGGEHILRVERNYKTFDGLAIAAIKVYFSEADQIGSVCTYFPPLDAKRECEALRTLTYLVQRDATGEIVRNQIPSMNDEKVLNGTILYAASSGAKYVTVSSHPVGSDYSACVSFTDINYVKNSGGRLR